MISNADIRAGFVGKIVFRPSPAKLAACLVFLRHLSREKPEIALLDQGAVLLLAEASHLSQYGRPVTGCRYERIDEVWIPELSFEASAFELKAVTEGRITLPVVSFPDDGRLPEEFEIAFPDLSGSDMDHLVAAANILLGSRTEAMESIEAMLHRGAPDYALMLTESDGQRLRRKLEDMASWSQYVYLGSSA